MSWLKFFWKSIKSGWTILAIVLGIVGNLDTILGWFVPTNTQFVEWISNHWPRLSWQTWIIFALMIILVSGITKAHRMYKDEVIGKLSLKREFESNRLILKQDFEQKIRDLWTLQKITSNSPVELQVKERTSKSQWLEVISPMSEIENTLPTLKKWLDWCSPKIDGVLEIKNTSRVPVRVRATGMLYNGTMPLSYENMTYIIQWQGLPDEEKILWPNDSAILYVVCFMTRPANKFGLPEQVLTFPTAAREKEEFKVNFIVTPLESFTEHLLAKQWKPKSVQIKIELNATSLLNPVNGTSKTMNFRIQPSESSKSLLFENITE
jgi:hypothetical protein